MARNDGKCTLKFKSRGDLLSALCLAEKIEISVENHSTEADFLLLIPADRVGTFRGIGSIHYGFEVVD